MKILKVIFKSLLILLLVVLLSVIGLTYYGLHHPKKVWNLIEARVLPKDLKITWEDLDFSPSPRSPRLWRPTVDFRNLCIVKQSPTLDVCFDELQVQGEISLEKIRSPRFEILNLLAVSNHQNFYKVSDEKKRTRETEQSFYEIAHDWQKRLRTYSHWIKVHQVEMAVNHFEIRVSKKPSLNLRFLIRGHEILESAYLEAHLESEINFSMATQGEVNLHHWLEGPGTFADLKFEMFHPKFQVRAHSAKFEWTRAEEISAQINGRVKVSQSDFENQLDVRLTSQFLSGKIQSIVRGMKKPFDQLKPLHATFSVPQQNGKLWADQSSSFKASSLLPLFFVERKLRPQLEKTCRCHLPEEIKVDVEGLAQLRRFFKGQEGEFLKMQAQVESLTNSLFSTRTVAQLSIARLNGKMKLEPFMDSEIVINSFQGVSAFLKTQNIAIPAPLSILDGTISLVTRGPVERSVDNWKMPFVLETKLKSSDQAVDLGAQGEVGFQPTQRLVSVNVDILLRNVVLQLPPMDPIYGVPRVTPDRRIEVQPPKVAAKKKQKAGYKLQLAVHVHSAQPQSLRFLYPLAKPAIPLALNINYNSGSPVKGQLSSAAFDINYLKRRSTVENFQMTLNDPTGTFPVKGRFRFDEDPYRIYVDVLGTVKTPQIVLSSDPYLDRADIISVLLYGRTSDQLVAVDANTVGSFDAAMADRAIGLIGLWAFASTPIQSFSYNQLNRQYSAQLKVSKDTTLSVGTNWEEATSLELQRRLSDHWIVSASLEPTTTNTNQEQQTRKIRLQWEDRF